VGKTECEPILGLISDVRTDWLTDWLTYRLALMLSLIFLFLCGQQPKSGPRRLIVEVSISHTIDTHTQPVVLWTSDQLVLETATYTTHDKHKSRTSIPSAGFETTIPAIDKLQTYTLDCTGTGIGSLSGWRTKIPYQFPNTSVTIVAG